MQLSLQKIQHNFNNSHQKNIHIKNKNMSQKWIQFTFSKLTLKQNTRPDFSKIILMISTETKIIRLKSPRILKNKTVNFFGQAITFSFQVHQFTIIISKLDQQNHQEQIGRIHINRQQIKTLKKFDHHFTGQNQALTLFWAAKITNQFQQDQSVSDNSQRDLSQIDEPPIKLLRTTSNCAKHQQFQLNRERKFSSNKDLFNQQLFNYSPYQKTLSSNKTEGKLRPSPSISIIEKAKTTSRISDRKKNKIQQKPKKYRQVSSQSKKTTSTSNRSIHIKYGITQFLCAGIVGAMAGYALHSFY